MGADKSVEITPNAPKFICPSPQVWDFDEKRLHWSSVVRVKNQASTTLLHLLCTRFYIGCSELPYFPCWHFYDIYIAGRSFEKAPKGSQLSHRSFEELTPRQNEAISSRLARRRHGRKPGNHCGVPASLLFLLSRMWVIFHTYFDLTSFFCARVNLVQEWGQPWHLWVLFTWLLVAGLVFLYWKSCASRIEKWLLKTTDDLKSLNWRKFIKIWLKITYLIQHVWIIRLSYAHIRPF